jgi:hypothetical protein
VAAADHGVGGAVHLRHGWSAFEDVLGEYDPELADLTDPLRPSVPLPPPR